MKVTPVAGLPDLKIVEPAVFGDARGFFFEVWNTRTLAAAGLDATFVQENHSRSARGVLRGLHYQLERPQGKLVRVAAGAIYDVAVDLRRASPTFGRSYGCTLDAKARRMLWVPPGFAHGFLALEEGTELIYACTDHYAPREERALAWDDPALGIAWPLAEIGAPTLSDRDRAALPLAQAETYP